MKKVIDLLGILGIVLGIITAIYVIYHESFEEKNPIMQLSVLSTSHPTTMSKVDGLLAKYKFKNRNVSDLWIEELSITNVGSTTLIGKGEQKNIIDDSLSFYIRRPFHFLSQIQANGDCGDVTYYLSNDTTVSMKFIQWRPKEHVTFKLYIEGDTSDAQGPVFSMNDRQIMNGIVKYLSAGDTDKNKLIKDSFENQAAISTVGLISSGFFGGCLLLLPYFIFDLIRSFVRYKKWSVANHDNYKLKVNTLVEEEKLKEFVKPTELPNYYWKMIDIERPKGNVDKVSELILLVFIMLLAAVAAFGAFAWTTPKFW